MSQKPMQLASPNLTLFQDDSWKPIYLEVKGQGHENIAGVGLCTILIAGFF